MRKKEERFVVTFATTTGAMAMERACQAAGLPGRLIPVPAWCVSTDTADYYVNCYTGAVSSG